MRGLRAWAVGWRHVNQIDGDQRYLMWDHELGQPFHYDLFRTRRECRAYIERHHGYLRTRPDLRAEPFGWRMPQAVRVTVWGRPASRLTMVTMSERRPRMSTLSDRVRAVQPECRCQVAKAKSLAPQLADELGELIGDPSVTAPILAREFTTMLHEMQPESRFVLTEESIRRYRRRVCTCHH